MLNEQEFDSIVIICSSYCVFNIPSNTLEKKLEEKFIFVSTTNNVMLLESDANIFMIAVDFSRIGAAVQPSAAPEVDVQLHCIKHRLF